MGLYLEKKKEKSNLARKTKRKVENIMVKKEG